MLRVTLAISGLLWTTAVMGTDPGASPSRPTSAASAPEPPACPLPHPESAADATRPRALQDIPDLSFDQIFRRPIGPRGLEYSERARSLVGRRVRMTGFSVRRSLPTPYSLLLSPLPVTLHEREYGLADDLPLSAVHVEFARGPIPLPPPVSGPIVLEGILELGPREEPDGRMSHVRLRVPTPWTHHAVLRSESPGPSLSPGDVSPTR